MFQKLLRMPLFLRAISWLVNWLHIPVLHTGKVVFVFSWQGVRDVLMRDNDFRVAPIYQEKMRGVAGDFFLGLDRCPLSQQQRDCGTRAMRMSTGGIAVDIAEAAQEALGPRQRTRDVIETYARPVACKTAKRVFGVPAPSDEQLMAATRAVFHETFLNPGDRDPQVTIEGRRAGASIRRWTLDEIDRRRREDFIGKDFLGYLLTRKELNDDERVTILSGHLVGAIDTTATAFGYIAYEILSKPSLLELVENDQHDLVRLRGWCYEVLRRRPQAPFLPRRTANPVELGGRVVPADKLVLAVTSSAHFDPNVFLAPDRMDPARPRENYFHFGTGPHHCAGREVNDIQLPLLLQAILARNAWKTGKLTYDGPFPASLVVTFNEKG